MVIQLTLRSQTIAELFPVVELLIEKSGRATICFGTWISIKMKERSANKVLNVTRKKNDSTTKQDMKDCGVAGSSVVLKSEFTTHTKKKNLDGGFRSAYQDSTTRRCEARYFGERRLPKKCIVVCAASADGQSHMHVVC